MITPEEVISRMQNELSDHTWNELVPVINGGGINLEQMRRYYMVCDYWEMLKENDGQVHKTIEEIAIQYDCSLPTVRYNVHYKNKK